MNTSSSFVYVTQIKPRRDTVKSIKPEFTRSGIILRSRDVLRTRDALVLRTPRNFDIFYFPGKFSREYSLY